MSGKVVSLAAEMTPYVSAAVGACGGAVLAKVREEAAYATVGLGSRLLQRVFRTRGEGEPLPGPLEALAADSKDDDALAAVRLAVCQMLAADPALAAELRSMLAAAPGVTQQIRAGRDAYAAGHDQTIVNYRGGGDLARWYAVPSDQVGRDAQLRQQIGAGPDAYAVGHDQIIVNIAVGAEPVAVPRMLPRDVPGFTGRDSEMDRLAGLAAGGSVLVSAIGGTAGVGKTALAIHAAHRLLPQFPDGQLYADLRGHTVGQAPAEPGEVLEVFLRRLGVPAQDMPAEAEERSGLLRQLLASRRVLIVLDNAATEAQVQSLLPGAGESLVLVISRSRLPGLEVDERIGLDVLAEDEATALLARLIGPERAVAETGAIKQVGDRCGRLPLALRIVGQLLAAHPAWPVARLAGVLADEHDRLGQLAAGDLHVRAAFEVSYAQLDDGDARVFRLLGLHAGGNFDKVAAANLAGMDPEAVGPVLDRLVLAHLITEDGSGFLFGMHDLLRLFARGICQETDDQATQDTAEARLVSYKGILATFLQTELDPLLRPAAAQAAERVGHSLLSPRDTLAMSAAERTSLLAALGLAAERGRDEQVGPLSGSMPGPLVLLRYFRDLLTVGKADLAAAQHAGDMAAEGTALNCVGTANRELGWSEEVISSYQDALAIFRETGDRNGEGETLGNLGIVYQQLRRSEEAISCHQDALAIFRETGNRNGEGKALDSLGIVYQQLRRSEEAISCHQDALAIFRETGNRHGEGTEHYNLGILYQELQCFEEAITCYQAAWTIRQETGDRHGEGKALGNLGTVYQDLRQFEEAITCYQDALAIFRETGDRHGEGKALGNLGTIYQELQRSEEAITCYQQSIALYRETGDRHGQG